MINLLIQKCVTIIFVLIFAGCSSTETKESRHEFSSVSTQQLQAHSIPIKKNFSLTSFLNLSVEIDYSQGIQLQDTFFRQNFIKIFIHPTISSDAKTFKPKFGFVSKNKIKVSAPAQISGSGPTTLYFKEKLIAINELNHWVIAGINKDNFIRLNFIEKSNGELAVHFYKPLQLRPGLVMHLQKDSFQSKIYIKESPAGGLILEIFNSTLNVIYHYNGKSFNEITK